MGQGQGKLFGLMAHPVHHSLSPLMHNAAYKALGIGHQYQAFDIAPEQLGKAIAAIRTLGIGGVNVSIPHKEKVIEFLDEIDDEAKVIGAVNTIVRQEDGRLKGYNTDGEGYVRSLLAETKVELPTASILLLGAGGAAKGIGIYLLKMGAQKITIANRTLAKAEELQKQLEAYSGSPHIHTLSLEELDETKLGEFTLIIHTTPTGMWPNIEQVPLSLKGIRPATIVSDIVYNPLHTAFLKQAESEGAIIHEGLGMFLYQGALAFERFTGLEAPIEVMKKEVVEQLQLGGKQ
nr:shikimate dehydrogenase [Bacillus horti]